MFKLSTHWSAVTRSIVGLKKEESEALLNFLVLHISRGIDYQARVRWAPKTVVVWDVSLMP
jgi:alpha-ketoglutarate-dependent taurine dioxygenase